jgi:hypothetical protein
MQRQHRYGDESANHGLLDKPRGVAGRSFRSSTTSLSSLSALSSSEKHLIGMVSSSVTPGPLGSRGRGCCRPRFMYARTGNELMDASAVACARKDRVAEGRYQKQTAGGDSAAPCFTHARLLRGVSTRPRALTSTYSDGGTARVRVPSLPSFEAPANRDVRCFGGREGRKLGQEGDPRPSTKPETANRRTGSNLSYPLPIQNRSPGSPGARRRHVHLLSSVSTERRWTRAPGLLQQDVSAESPSRWPFGTRRDRVKFI